MDKAIMAQKKERVSAGHTIGSAIGNWFEKFFVLPLLGEVAQKLDLFLDNRFIERPARGEKITWEDGDGNSVDYDFVLELDGTPDKIGSPIGFLECFWRKEKRHAKDKARDDSGKLMPMHSTYPTARFLGIIAAGDFTGPASNWGRSRDIDLFYIPKAKIIEAFKRNKLSIDYIDKAPETEKEKLLLAFEECFTDVVRGDVAKTLKELVGRTTIRSYLDRVRAKLGALPQEIRLILRHESAPFVFASVGEVTNFLTQPGFTIDQPIESYVYQITYSDGGEFEKVVTSIEDLKNLHLEVQRLTDHVARLS
jgi:hypothetical protein